MATAPAPGPETDLLRMIVKGRSPGYMSSVLEEFQDLHGLPDYVTFDPSREPMPDLEVITLAKSLARKGLITYKPARVWPEVAATDAGRQWARQHPK